jgi:hypothetical protein
MSAGRCWRPFSDFNFRLPFVATGLDVIMSIGSSLTIDVSTVVCMHGDVELDT